MLAYELRNDAQPRSEQTFFRSETGFLKLPNFSWKEEENAEKGEKRFGSRSECQIKSAKFFMSQELEGR